LGILRFKTGTPPQTGRGEDENTVDRIGQIKMSTARLKSKPEKIVLSKIG
jgi:hypothetical protein